MSRPQIIISNINLFLCLCRSVCLSVLSLFLFFNSFSLFLSFSFYSACLFLCVSFSLSFSVSLSVFLSLSVSPFVFSLRVFLFVYPSLFYFLSLSLCLWFSLSVFLSLSFEIAQVYTHTQHKRTQHCTGCMNANINTNVYKQNMCV